jgi:hypothetical protein
MTTQGEDVAASGQSAVAATGAGPAIRQQARTVEVGSKLWFLKEVSDVWLLVSLRLAELPCGPL